MRFDQFVTVFGDMHEDQVDCYIVSEAQLSRDFGPWKAGEQADLTFDFLSGTIKQFDDNGKILKECKFKLEVDDGPSGGR